MGSVSLWFIKFQSSNDHYTMQVPVLYSIKWLWIRPRYLNLRVLTSLRYLLYSSCRSLASFSLISSTGRPRWVMKPIRLSGRVFSCFLNRSASCFYNTNNKVQTCACSYDKCGRKNEIWWLVLFISLRLKAFNLFNKHMHWVYIAWLLS